MRPKPQYRQVLVRMGLGDSDREIARAGLMGRRKAAALHQVALDQGWLNRDQPVPEEAHTGGETPAKRGLGINGTENAFKP